MKGKEQPVKTDNAYMMGYGDVDVSWIKVSKCITGRTPEQVQEQLPAPPPLSFLPPMPPPSLHPLPPPPLLVPVSPSAYMPCSAARVGG
eukprot:759190-Hanusia_phi.AAC.7